MQQGAEVEKENRLVVLIWNDGQVGCHRDI